MQHDTWGSQEKCFHIKTNLLDSNNSSSVSPTQHRSSYFSSALATLLGRWSLLVWHTQPSWLLSFPTQVAVEVHHTSAPGRGSSSPRDVAHRGLAVAPKRTRVDIAVITALKQLMLSTCHTYGKHFRGGYARLALLWLYGLIAHKQLKCLTWTPGQYLPVHLHQGIWFVASKTILWCEAQ